MSARLPKPKLDFKKITNVELDGIDFSDAFDFVDAYILSADYDGREATEEEIELMNDDSDFVYRCVQEEIYG